MTPTLRTAILDALMARWRESASHPEFMTMGEAREYFASCLDMILPVAEPMIREATLRNPTDAMLDAARDLSYRKYGKPIGSDAAISCWQAMFDAPGEPK